MRAKNTKITSLKNLFLPYGALIISPIFYKNVKALLLIFVSLINLELIFL